MGYCPYWIKCQFAHGQHELVKYNTDCMKGYRTKKCKSFWEEGICRYGFRCQFLHYETKINREKHFMNNCCSILSTVSPAEGTSRLLTIL